MRILRTRSGFQADHSSSSYLFYAVDHPVSKKGQQIAHRFSSRADVDEHAARYQKWGESELSWDAHKALLSEHYDVMASESYDWWTLMIALPKTPQIQALLKPFKNARGGDDLGIEVENFGHRLVVTMYCMFDYEGPVFGYNEDSLDSLVERLSVLRGEIVQGNVSYLRAVASFYDAETDEENEEADAAMPLPVLPDLERQTKAALQKLCAARGIDFRQSWTKQQLLTALADAVSGPEQSAVRRSRTGHPRAKSLVGTAGKAARLSKAGQDIVKSLDRP